MGNCFGVGRSRRSTDISNDLRQSNSANQRNNNAITTGGIDYYEMSDISMPVQFKPGHKFPIHVRSNPSRSQSHLRLSHHLCSSKLEKISVAWTTPVPITKEQLLQKQMEFWETAPAYGGDPHVWQTLREAVQVGQNDIETAKTMLICAGIQVIDGHLTESFDERGFLYQIPPYCLCLPTNGLVDRYESSNEKAVQPCVLESVTVRLSNGEDLSLRVDHDMNVKQIKEALKPKIETTKRMELFWAGMGPLEDSIKLSTLCTDNHVETKLQCWVFN